MGLQMISFTIPENNQRINSSRSERKRVTLSKHFAQSQNNSATKTWKRLHTSPKNYRVASCLIANVLIWNKQLKKEHQRTLFIDHTSFNLEMQRWLSRRASIYKFTILIHQRRNSIIILVKTQDHWICTIFFSNNS